MTLEGTPKPERINLTREGDTVDRGRLADLVSITGSEPTLDTVHINNLEDDASPSGPASAT